MSFQTGNTFIFCGTENSLWKHCLWHFHPKCVKRIVYSQPLFSHPHVIPNLYFFPRGTQNEKMHKQCTGYFFFIWEKRSMYIVLQLFFCVPLKNNCIWVGIIMTEFSFFERTIPFVLLKGTIVITHGLFLSEVELAIFCLLSLGLYSHIPCPILPAAGPSRHLPSGFWDIAFAFIFHFPLYLSWKDNFKDGRLLL